MGTTSASLLANAALSTGLNVVVLAGVPFLLYAAYHRRRHRRSWGEIAARAGLQWGSARYVVLSLALAAIGVGLLVLFPPPLDPFLRKGSPQRAFLGLGLGGPAVAMALLYGVVKTGFPEELLFRGLIAGSLSRRLPLIWANLVQTVIFFLPHLLLLRIMPEMMWKILPVVFAGTLFSGWVRIRSGSIVGSWLVHASVNVAICLSVASRTPPPE
jgi:membrane protease YdiL (CAAX protease family)